MVVSVAADADAIAVDRVCSNGGSVDRLDTGPGVVVNAVPDDSGTSRVNSAIIVEDNVVSCFPVKGDTDPIGSDVAVPRNDVSDDQRACGGSDPVASIVNDTVATTESQVGVADHRVGTGTETCTRISPHGIRFDNDPVAADAHPDPQVVSDQI